MAIGDYWDNYHWMRFYVLTYTISSMSYEIEEESKAMYKELNVLCGDREGTLLVQERCFHPIVAKQCLIGD